MYSAPLSCYQERGKIREMGFLVANDCAISEGVNGRYGRSSKPEEKRGKKIPQKKRGEGTGKGREICGD